MSPEFILLALLSTSLTASLPIDRASHKATTHHLSSVPSDASAHALAKRTTANPPFDPYDDDYYSHRSDGDVSGDIFRLTKCYCIDTPSEDLPPVYGQYYGSYYGFDYYNYHKNKSYAFSWTCASGELETLNAEFSASEYYFLAPKCLSWMEEEKKQCWDTGDGNEFCAEANKGKDYYYWNGQKRKVHNHPSAPGTTKVAAPPLNEECQRMCQTVPANTEGYMQDVVPSDHEHKINLATQTMCDPRSGISMDLSCGDGRPGSLKQPPKTWETWNFIETYTDQADMCKGCA